MLRCACGSFHACRRPAVTGEFAWGSGFIALAKLCNADALEHTSRHKSLPLVAAAGHAKKNIAGRITHVTGKEQPFTGTGYLPFLLYVFLLLRA